ncbi:MAG: CBS domain-containing protein [Chloroflexi bacterium]|nr:CBS domain-containing protein [Chloroflexota bacterium]
MNVGEQMSQPAIVVSPSTPVATAMKLIRQRHIRRLPVVDDGVLVGIVSERDLLRAMPSPATSLTVWEIPELLERLHVHEVMTRQVVVVQPDTPIKEAAQLMVDHKIGGLPVVEDGRVVGVITETDIFRVFVTICNGVPAATAGAA